MWKMSMWNALKANWNFINSKIIAFDWCITMLVRSWGVERSSVWSAVLPRLIPAHLLKVGDLPTGKHEVAKVAPSGEYLDKDVGLKLPKRGAFFGQRRACLGCSSEDFEMAESKIRQKNPHSADWHLPHWLIWPVIPVLSCAINDSGANGGNGGKWRTFANGKKRRAIICGGIQVSSWGNFTTKCKHTAPVVAKPNEESKIRT